MHYSQIRTNFIREDKGWEDSFLTYYYENDFDIDFIGCRILVYAFIDFERNYRSVAKITFRELFNLCGKKGDSKRFKKSKTYSLIADCLQWFIDNKYITIISDKPLDEYYFDETVRIKLTDLFLPSVKMVYSEDLKKVIPKTHEPFILLSQSELETFENMSNGSVPRLIAVYAYIKSRCDYRYGERTIQDRPICFWETQQKMARHFHCTQAQLSQYIEQLCSVGILKRKPLAHSSKGKAPYVYTYEQPNWEQELYYGVKKFNQIYKFGYLKNKLNIF